MASKESLTRPYQLVIEGKHSNKENTNQIQIILLTSSTHPNGHKNVSTENPVNIIPNDIFPPKKKTKRQFPHWTQQGPPGLCSSFGMIINDSASEARLVDIGYPWVHSWPGCLHCLRSADEIIESFTWNSYVDKKCQMSRQIWELMSTINSC